MNWEQRYFKGKKVYAQVDAAGELVVENGRVPMKYSPAEDAKVYRASAGNLSSSAGEAREDANGGRKSRSNAKNNRSGTATRSKKSTTPGTKSPSGPLQPSAPARVSDEVPDELLAINPPPPGQIEVYTDGACSKNPGPCGYGLLIRHGDSYREVSQYLGHGTNNIAELTAIKVALEQIEDPSKPVRLYTDSSYSIGVLTKNWKAKANQALIAGIRSQIAKFEDLRLIKVKGHAGHPLNERADTLATSSIAER